MNFFCTKKYDKLLEYTREQKLENLLEARENTPNKDIEIAIYRGSWSCSMAA
jgi:hypothetical protein